MKPYALSRKASSLRRRLAAPGFALSRFAVCGRTGASRRDAQVPSARAWPRSSRKRSSPGGHLLSGRLVGGHLLSGRLVGGHLLSGRLVGGHLLSGRLVGGHLLSGRLVGG